MSLLIETLGLGHLSPTDRLRLAQELCASVGPEIDSLLTEEQRRDLLGRIEDDDRDPDEGTPWEDVRALLQDRAS